MSGFYGHVLTVLTLLPLCGAALVLLLPGAHARTAALATSGAAFLLAARTWWLFDPTNASMQLLERHTWIKALKVEYVVGVDGFSAALVLLVGILGPVALLASENVADRPRVYFALMLLLQTALFGAFTALSFFHWFLYWELSLVPAFFLVKIWGGKNAGRSALMFFLYTLLGSVLLLLAFQAIYIATGTFDFMELRALGARNAVAQQLTGLALNTGFAFGSSAVGAVVFLAVGAAFFIKTPMWPVHTWLPDTYADAPTPVTMILTGALSKLGVYGLLRIALPLFPDAAMQLSGLLTLLAVLTIVTAAFAALRQTDLKRTMAYASMSHVGYCLLGAFAAMSMQAGQPVPGAAEARVAALDGVVVQMFNHGISGAALFWFVSLLEQRTRLRDLDAFGGLRTQAPLMGFGFAFVLFGTLGLPGLSGFIGELLVFKGALMLAPLGAGVAVLGIVVGAVYCLRIVQRVCWGPVAGRTNDVTDLTPTEIVIAFVLCGLVFVCGIWPGPLVEAANAAAQAFVSGSIIRGAP